MTAPAPSGVVTFLFTDIEGSTRRWDAKASASSVAALPVPRQVERFVNSRPLRQLHRWHSGIIGHGRTDWMKSDNCRFSSSHDPKHTLEEGGGKGGRGGQRDRQPRPARFRAELLQ